MSKQDILQYVIVGLLTGCFWWQRGGHDTLAASSDTLGEPSCLMKHAPPKGSAVFNGAPILRACILNSAVMSLLVREIPADAYKDGLSLRLQHPCREQVVKQ